MALLPGAVVGGYRIVGTLGSGGMGAVYLGQHPSLPRQDAIKILNEQLSNDPEFRARFEREGSLAAGLDHPNIVSVYNRGEEAGQLWIAMQFVPGTDASEEVAKGPAVMTPQRALRIISEVGKGLDYAHRRRLLHRDIKPANFLLSNPDGEDERVLLTDFGVAKSVEDGQDLTATGKFMATVAYASPEQLLGHRLDHRSDIYSLGCSLYRLLVGENPYPSTVPAVVMMGHLNEPPPRITAVRQDLPLALDHVFARVLAKNPEERYNTCRDFVIDAEAALYGSTRHQAPDTGHHRITHTYVPTASYGPSTASPQEVTQRDLGAIATWPDNRVLPSADSGSGPRSDRSRRRLLASVAAAIATIIAIAGGMYAVSSGGPDTSGPNLADVRSEYPGFAGKTVAALHYGNTQLSAVLDGSPQANFLRDIGFRYSTEFQSVGEEPSPRPLTISGFGFSEPIDLIIILRSDDQAGNGGLGGLPSNVMNPAAKIAVIDEVSTLQAFQVWTDQSPGKLVADMVPLLSKALA